MRNGGKIAIILSGFPRRSETFALNEVLTLEQRNALAAVFATKRGDDAAPHPKGKRLLGPVRVLPEGTPAEQAKAVVTLLEGKAVSGVHGYFAHQPAEVARIAAAQLGVPFGFSVHARDARKISSDTLADRARAAACVVACNTDVASDLRGSGAALHVVPHGVDLDLFRPTPHQPFIPVRLLAVGRLVEKKGFHILLAAAARLRSPFRLRIVGDGPQRPRLEALISAAGLGDRVTLCGANAHEELPQEYGEAHIVVVPSVMDQTGDRDGLPNVLLEAMACGRPVIASDIGAVRSAVAHDQTGRLTEPGDAASLAAAIEVLARRPSLVCQLGEQARKRVERDYDLRRCTERFHEVLRTAYA